MNKKPFSLENSKKNIPTLSVINSNGKKLYIHSRFDPYKEASGFNDLLINTKYKFLIILGLGLGYHLSLSCNYIKNLSKIIIIDFLPDIENKIKNLSTNWLIKQNNIEIITGKNIEFIENFFDKKINFEKLSGFAILEHPASVRAFPEYYQNIKDIIQKITNKKAGNLATKKTFGNLYLNNSIKNLLKLNTFYPVKNLFKKYKNIPAIIISSAPSLDYYISWIKKNQHNFIKIAVDSALPVLKNYNIIPDYVVSIDPQPWISEHFNYINSEKINLVTSLSAWDIKKENCNKFLSLNTHPFSQIIDYFYPDIIGSIDSQTGNVAGDAINLAIKMNCNPILITGLDFSFPDFNIYARGTAYQKRYNCFFNNRFLQTESFNANYITKSSKNIKKENKMTRKSFLQYKNLLENFIKKEKKGNEIYHLVTKGFPLQKISIINNLNSADKIISKKNMVVNPIKKSDFITQIIDKKLLVKKISNPEIINNIITNSFISEISDYKRKKILNKLG